MNFGKMKKNAKKNFSQFYSRYQNGPKNHTYRNLVLEKSMYSEF